MNADAPWPDVDTSWFRVLRMQTKLHQWAKEEPQRRFDDLFNLVADPAFLMVAWDRVRNNTGARSAGVDGWPARLVEERIGVIPFLSSIRADLRSGTFRPLPVKERLIPKPGTTKKRRLGVPTVQDRVVQATMKLVMEPIFEADFQPCSYGFRPNRRTHDAVAEIHLLASHSYEWVFEADIEACFDSIDHTALLGRVRRRIGDKRVTGLVKSFLKAGIMRSDGSKERTTTGTPQGGILSPLLANIALSVLDEHAMHCWHQTMGTQSRRQRRRIKGLANWRLIRYADDFVVMVTGTRDQAEQLRTTVEEVLAPMGLHLSPPKTQVVHIDKGFDFLGWRIQRHRKRGTNKRFVYTYPAKKSVLNVVGKIRKRTARTAQSNLKFLLISVNALLRGWCNYFRHGVSSNTFNYLRAYTWWRVARWIRKRHHGLSWKHIKRRYMNNSWHIAVDGTALFNPAGVKITRYRYRGSRIPTPWTIQDAA